MKFVRGTSFIVKDLELNFHNNMKISILNNLDSKDIGKPFTEKPKSICKSGRLTLNLQLNKLLSLLLLPQEFI